MCLLPAVFAQAQAPVWTFHNDNARSGALLSESTLNAGSVSSARFAKLATYPLEDTLITQPLYLPSRRLVFAASAGSIYCFDALKPGAPVWTAGLGGSLEGHPVLDVASATLYVATREGEGQQLHALNALTGAEKPGSPAVVPGAGSDPAPLTLANGAVFLGWANGVERWVAAYDAQTLEQVIVFRNPSALVALEPGSILLPGAGAPLAASRLTAGKLNGGPVLWNSPDMGPIVYAWADGDTLKAWQVRGAAVEQAPVMQGLAPGKGAWLALSANGGTAGTGVVWALMSAGPDSGMPEGSAVLRAFDASNLSQELWNSNLNAARDGLGAFVPTAPPTIAEGRVWVAGAGGLHVYGLLETSRGAMVAVRKSAGVAMAAAAPNQIGIKFVGLGTSMGAAVTAGVVPQKNWNNAMGQSSASALALVDENGAASGATVTWSSEVSWHLPIQDVSGDPRLMYGYIDTLGNTPTTVTVSNLPISANGYTVYVYSDGDNGIVTRTGVYQIGAASKNIIDTANFGGTYIAADNTSGNYAIFGITGTGFTLTATAGASNDRYKRAPVNAIQIVPSGTPDFSISVDPASRSVAPGGSTTYTVTVAPQFGFAGSVALSATGLPAGVTASFAPASVSGAGSSTLTVSTTAATAAGSTGFTLTGASGGLSHTATATLAVSTVPSGTGHAISVNFVGQGSSLQASETAGVVAKAFWNNAAGVSSSSPQALMDENGAASGATLTWSSQVGWSLPITPIASDTRMMSGYIDTLGSSPTSVTVAGLASGSYDVYVYCDGDNQSVNRTARYQIGATALTCTDAVGATFGGTYTQGSNYLRFSVSGTGFTLTATPLTSDNSYLRAPLNGLQIVPSGPPAPDFTLGVAPAGGNGFTVTVAGQNGFSGTVSLGISGLPGGATASFSPASIAGSGSSTLTISGATNAGFTVTGISGSLSHTASGTLALPDFTLGVAGSTVTVTAQNGFSGTVALSAAGLPSSAAASFSPPSITGSGTSTLTVTGLAAASTFNVVGTSGSLVHTAPVTITPPDFTLTVAGSTVTVAALNGFTGVVTLGTSGVPAGATVSFSAPSITGSGSATFTVTSAASFTFTVTGISGSLTHSAQASYTAGPVVQPAPISINFTGLSSAMGPAEVAGAVAKSHWNNAIGKSSSSPLALMDETGAATGATATWSSDVSWKLPTDTSAGNFRMMSGYIDTTDSTPTVVTVAGLAPNAYGYNVYVYSDGDNGIVKRTAAYTIGAVTKNVTDQANFTGTYTEGVNYVTFFVPGTGFSLSAAPVSSTDSYPRAPVNGIQILPAGPADFTISALGSAQNITPGGGASYNLKVASLNGFSGTVSLGVSGLPGSVTAVFNPASVSGSGNVTLSLTSTAATPVGNYNLTVTATSGALSHTAPLTLGVNISLGLLSGSLWTPSGNMNLTALGTQDWAHWGYNFAANFNHKAGITPQISNVTVYNGEPGLLGSMLVTSGLSFTWNDGTPNPAVTATSQGVRVMGLNKGMQFSVPADTTTRTLTVYLGAWNTIGKMVAHLSDGSAPDYVDSSISSPSMAVQTDAAYTFTYRAASPGQTLVLTYIMTDITGPRCLAWEVYGTHCYVTLNAATLQ